MSDDTKNTDKKSKKSDDMMSGIGGIFDVPGGTKKKKKKKKASDTPPAPPTDDIGAAIEEELAAASEAEEVDVDDDVVSAADESSEHESTADESDEVEAAPAPKKAKKAEPKAAAPKKKKSKAATAGIEGVFTPSKSDDDDDIDLSSTYLDDDDLGDIPAPKNPMTKVLVGVVVVLVVGMLAMLHHFTGFGDDFMLLLQGNYQEEMLRRAQQAEEEHLAAQLAAMPRYGNLTITGNPVGATIKLNGQIQYGQVGGEDGPWRALELGPSTAIQNLSVRDTHHIEVTAPGHQPATITLTEGMWQDGGNGDYRFNYNANLVPIDAKYGQEFAQRMESDLDNDFYGEATINTIPSGAQILLNNNVALNEDGEELRTPVTFGTYYIKDEESGELKEMQLRVDTPPDRGDRLELAFPDNDELPNFLTSINRRTWECNWKDEAETRRLPDDASIQLQCDYTWTLEKDFNAINRYIAEREAEFERIQAQQEEAMKKAQEAAAEAAGQQG
ncbi:hypothetical protein FRC96_19185 [Lujinxingia vulgaris]|uniref:Uncharacterized protein n=1 Tax=Lujinxingia vulgaris TaxID=2600176 RepID=A0A5C6X496_9DELT|nr:hypothetical protein [Lujinxingia vulgaris]TXD32028.1 hypothetical protein FRC96_19185 [Lujinxingia vulgaris]